MPHTTPHAARRDRLRALLSERRLPGALVTRLVNVRYLTGFTGSNAALLVTAEGALLATDGRYVEQAAREVPDTPVVVDRACAAALASRAHHDGLTSLGFESHDVTVDVHRTLADVAPGVDLVSLGPAVERLRTVKDDGEVALVREACAIGDRALADVLPTIRPGLREREVARALEAAMVAHGADGPAFDTIVASGPHSAVPHHRAGDRVVERGDLLKIDFGARYRGYHSDMTRTFVVGAPPATWQVRLHGLVRTAQEAGRRALRPGADVRDVDAAARAVVAEAGHGEHFPHGLGHGIGLEVHEAPFLGQAATGTLQGGTPVTVEPGVYLPGQGGVRIEDTLVVGVDGGPEALTVTTRELLVL